MKNSSTEVRRFKDIVAFKQGSESAVAFHAQNLEIADISEELWSEMPTTHFREAVVPQNISDKNLERVLNDWNSEVPDLSALSKKSEFRVKTITLNVTQICNLHCHYCAAGGDGSYGDPTRQISIEKSLPQIKFFMDQLGPKDSFHIIFLGGEPLLYPEAIRGIGQYTLELAANKGPEFQTSFRIITNGTLISQKFAEMMRPLHPAITLSMDGDPVTNDLARPQKNGQGSSAAALAGLKILLENRDVFSNITIHGVFTKSNLNIVQAYQFFSEFPVDQLEFTLDVSKKDEDVNQKYIQQMIQVAHLAFDRGGESALRKIILFDGYFKAFDEQMLRPNHCTAGKSLVSIDSKNRIYTCPLEVNHRESQVGEGQALDYDKISNFQTSLVEQNNCQNCWARFVCGGGCMYNHKATTGHPNQKHITYCERTRSLISEAIMLYKLNRVLTASDVEN